MKRLARRAIPTLVGILCTLGAARARADALYEVTKTEPKVAVGGTGTASVTIKAKGGWHVNAEAPITVALTAPAGLSVAKAKLGRGDLAASTVDSARFDIPVSATEAGKKSIGAEARFVICQESACKPVKETLTLAVDVAPTATASATPPSSKSKKKRAH
jgi:hypothetical protein